MLTVAGIGVVFAGAEPEMQPAATPEPGNSHDLFSYETTYTFQSDFEESKLGHEREDRTRW